MKNENKKGRRRQLGGKQKKREKTEGEKEGTKTGDSLRGVPEKKKEAEKRGKQERLSSKEFLNRRRIITLSPKNTAVPFY